MIIFVMGPAGSGKTSLVNKFSQWLKLNLEAEVGIINLDPAVDYLPYVADIDVREIVDARKLMREERLGPNGALIRAMEILSENSEKIVKSIEALKKDYIMVDTPGQLDMFVFHDFGEKILSNIDITKSVGIFLWDPKALISELNAADLFLLTLVVRFRLQMPIVPVVSKIDTVAVSGGVTFHDSLWKIVEKMEKQPGTLLELLHKVYNVLIEFSIPTRIVKVSSVTQEGFSELFSIIKEVFCVCGDLT